MDQTAQLIAAVGALWAALQLLGGGVVRYLVVQRAADQKKCDERIAALETKLDESSDLIRRQAEGMQKQIEAQQQLITGLQAALAHPPAGGPP